MDIIRKNKGNFLIVIVMLLFIASFNFIFDTADGKNAYGMTRSKYSWDNNVNDKTLNRKNGTPYGTGSGQLVCTTYVSWALHNLYKVIGYPSGGIVTTHYNWLRNNAKRVCTISSPSLYKKYKKRIKPGDIVVYNTGSNFRGIWVHIAIVGGDSRTLHHAISSGVSYKYTVGGWLGEAADVRKQAASCKVYRLLSPKEGKLTVTKSASKNIKIVSKLKNYSLKGAVYKVYKKKSKHEVHTFKTDEKGKSHTWTAKPGTYYIKETKAPKHFKKDKKWYKVILKPGEKRTFKASDMPLFTKSGFLLRKMSENTKKPLQGAIYEVKYYDNDHNQIKGKPVKKWKIKTDINGYADLGNNEHLAEGSPFRDEKKEVVLPFGTYSYREVKAPEGYELDNKTYTAKQVNDVKYNIKNVSDKSITPEIKTRAMDENTNSNILSFGNNTKVSDRIKYYNLEKGESYTIKGRIVNKATEKTQSSSGKPVISEKTFTPKERDGEITLNYLLDSRKLSGKTLVIFEELYFKGEKIASHCDKFDSKQTLYSPHIKTKALDDCTKDSITQLSKKTTVIDKVKYSNLNPGENYKIYGTIVDKKTGKPVLNSKGEKITGEKIFRAETSDGEAEVQFDLNTEYLAGKTTVIFEKCFYNNKLIAVHHDIKDKNQTVKIPSLRTKAKINTGENNPGDEKGFVSVVDRVKYYNLIAGKSYSISGILMDKESGKPLLSAENKTIKAEKNFIPKGSKGDLEIEFKVERKVLRGKRVVVFEDCFLNNIKIASHADINDKDQTVEMEHVIPEAKDKQKEKTNSHGVQTGDKSTLWKFIILLISTQILLAGIIFTKFLKTTIR